jgi:multiple sugar transport system permease protein
MDADSTAFTRVWRARSVQAGRLVWSVFRALLIIGICYVILFPLLGKLATSFMAEVDMFDPTVHWVPRHFTLDNYRTVLDAIDYFGCLRNSFGLATMVAVLQLASCTLVGYGFARFDFRGREFLFALVLLTLIVPPQMIMIPLYLSFRYFDPLGLLPGNGINLLNSYWPFALTSATAMGMRNGLFIYIMRQYFRGMPAELEEAAYVDGAGALRTFFQVMLPSAVPVMVIVFLFSFVWQWNDDFYSTLFMARGQLLSSTIETLPLLILGDVYRTSHLASILNNTGMMLTIGPMLILYALLQRHFVESVERSGLVG